MKKNKDNLLRKILYLMFKYLAFFLMIAFVVSCCMMLFISLLLEETGLTSIDGMDKAAQLTFANILMISFLFTLFDWIRRKVMYGIPVERIINGCEKIINGDFTVRIQHVRYIENMEDFNTIINYFNIMAEELSKTETLRADFISNVSHELKTPLAIMQNYAVMLQNPNLSEEKRAEYAKNIAEASRRLTNLITNILKLNKLENQQIFPKREIFDLSRQICECLLEFEDVWEEKELDVEADIEEKILVNEDEEILTLIWNNLFSNAIKFTPQKGKILVSVKQEEGFVVVTVADTGCGISKDVGAHIFEKFYQGDISHATQGNGLGLALVKRVVDIIGGDIWVQSELGQGSTFTVRLRRNTDGR